MKQSELYGGAVLLFTSEKFRFTFTSAYGYLGRFIYSEKQQKVEYFWHLNADRTAFEMEGGIIYEHLTDVGADEFQGYVSWRNTNANNLFEGLKAEIDSIAKQSAFAENGAHIVEISVSPTDKVLTAAYHDADDNFLYSFLRSGDNYDSLIAQFPTYVYGVIEAAYQREAVQRNLFANAQRDAFPTA